MSKKAKIFMTLCPNCKTIQRSDSICPLCNAPIPPVPEQAEEKEDQKKRMEFIGNNIRIEFCKLAQEWLKRPRRELYERLEETHGPSTLISTPEYNPLEHLFHSYSGEEKEGEDPLAKTPSEKPLLGFGSTLRVQVPDTEGNYFMFDVTELDEGRVHIQHLEQVIQEGEANVFNGWDEALHALPGQENILPLGYRAHLRIDCFLSETGQARQTQPILGPTQEQPSFSTEQLEGIGLVAPPTPGWNPLQHAFQTYLYEPKAGGGDLPLGYGDTLRFQVPDAEGNISLYDVTYQPDNRIKVQQLEQILHYGTETLFDTWDSALEALPGREILPMGHFAKKSEYNRNENENPYLVDYEKTKKSMVVDQT